MRRFLLISLLALGFSTPATAASVDGIELYSSSVGTGPTIIFVHGWTCDTSSWRDQVPAFQDDYRVVTLDLPGHGRSESPAEDEFSMDLFARAVEAVRAEAGAERVVLVGHSMGVVVIRQYAITYPDRVAGLVAVDYTLDLDTLPTLQEGQERPPMTVERRQTLIRSMFSPATSPELREHLMTMMMTPSEATANGAGRALFDPSIRTRDVIYAPTLAVVRSNLPVPDVDALREIVPNLEATRMEGAGHFLMMEKPGEFNLLLRSFLDKIGY